MHKWIAAGLTGVLAAVFVLAGCIACAQPQQETMSASHPCCNPNGGCKPTHSSDNQLKCDIPDLGGVAKPVKVELSLVASGFVAPAVEFAAERAVAVPPVDTSPPVCPSINSVLRI
jgi:hypothetical protein